MEEMGQVGNLEFINESIQTNGATHVLNIKIGRSDETPDTKITPVYTKLKQFINCGQFKNLDATTHTYDIGSADPIRIRWICNSDAASSAYFYSVCEHADSIVLAHVRRIIMDFIEKVSASLDDEKKRVFEDCTIVYSITKTAGFIHSIKVKKDPVSKPKSPKEVKNNL
jgi:hypothetical protein